MWRFGRPQVLPVALDVSADGIRMMQLAREEGGLRVVAAVRRLFDSPRLDSDRPGRKTVYSHLADELSRALAQAPFTTRRVIAAIPSELVHLRTLRLPATSGAELEALVRKQGAGSFPFDLAGATLRCVEAGSVRQEGQRRLEVIAAAARGDEVTAFLDQIQAAGLRVDSLRLAPFATLRCAQRIAPRQPAGTEPATCAMIEVAIAATTVMIARGNHVSFLKFIPIGGQHLNQAVAQKLGMTGDEVVQLRQRLSTYPDFSRGAIPAEATQTSSGQTDPSPREGIAGAVFDATRTLLEELAHQVAMCFRYHGVTFPGSRPTFAALLGAEAADPNLRAALAAAIPVMVEVVNPLAGIETAAMRRADCGRWEGEWTTCVGLALGQFPDLAHETPGAPHDKTSAAPDSPAVAPTTEMANA